MKKHFIRVEASEGPSTQGTRVFAGDQELTGITRIELTAGTNDLWRGRVELICEPPKGIEAEVDLVAADIRALTEEQRLELFSQYCIHCGAYDPGHLCRCWDDS